MIVFFSQCRSQCRLRCYMRPLQFGTSPHESLELPSRVQADEPHATISHCSQSIRDFNKLAFTVPDPACIRENMSEDQGMVTPYYLTESLSLYPKRIRTTAVRHECVKVCKTSPSSRRAKHACASLNIRGALHDDLAHLQHSIASMVLGISVAKIVYKFRCHTYHSSCICKILSLMMT